MGSVTGRTLTLDNRPQNAIFVQALDAEDGQPAAGVFSDEGGVYRFVDLPPGSYRLRCQLARGYAWWGEDGETEDAPLEVPAGATLDGVDLRFPRLKRGRWQSYNRVDGLPSAWVESAYEDHHGVMWFGTTSGLVRFDGERFASHTFEPAPPGGQGVHDIQMTRDGRLWAATSGGLLCRDGAGDLRLITTGEGLPADDVRGLAEADDGGLWLATGAGACRYDDGRVQQALTEADGLLSNAVHDVHEAADGSLWLACVNGVCRFDGVRFESITTMGVAPATRDLRYQLCETRAGDLWFAAGDGGIACWDRERLRTFGAADGLAGGPVMDLFEDRDGHLWIGTYGHGVARFDGSRFVTFTPTDGLAHDRVASICQSRDGSLWFATLSGGVSRYRFADLETFTTADGMPSDRVLSVDVSVGGELRAGTARGACRRSRGRLVPITDADGPGERVVNAVRSAADGTLWLGALTGGCWRLDPGGVWEHLATEPGRDTIWDIHIDADGTAWLATSGGLGRIRGTEDTWYGEQHGLRTLNVRTVCQAADGLHWAGAYDGGVARFETDRWRSLGIADGLCHDIVIDLFCDRDGTLWAGTYGGLSRIDRGGSMATVFDAGGRPLPAVEATAQTPDGLLWVATGGLGVWLFDGEAWSTIDSRDGLPADNVYDLAVGADGEVWIGTGAGLVRYRRDTAPPKIVITGVRADRRYAHLDDLPPIPTGTRITIDYQATDYKTTRRKRQYRCRIPQIGLPWAAPSHRSSFEWTPEEPGDYTFEVQAIDRDLNYSEPARLELRVVPLPHEEALRQARLELEEAYRTLAATNEQLQQSNEAAQAARREAESANAAKSIFLANMSHEIRTPMNAILGFTRMLRRNEDLDADVQDRLATIARNGDHLLALINDVLDLSKVEAGRIEREDSDFDLVGLVADVASTFLPACQERGLRWRTRWQPDMPTQGRVLGDEGKLRQVLVNLIGNAVKFTEQGSITLTVEALEDDRWRFSVRDTGPGIEASIQARVFEPFEQAEAGARAGGTGLGLAIARRFVELMEGELELESARGSGATFRFAIALPATGAGDRTAVQASLRFEGRQAPRALVVDDVVENRVILDDLLRSIGVRVFTTDSGRSGLRELRRASFDVVFLDVRMPDVSGLEVARILRNELGPSCPRLVAVSASALPHERLRFLEAGFDAFLPKPIRERDVMVSLADALQVELSATDESAPPDLADAVLPGRLLSSLREAAALGDLTALQEVLAEVATQPGAAALSAHLERIVQAVDLEALRSVLRQVREEDD